MTFGRKGSGAQNLSSTTSKLLTNPATVGLGLAGLGALYLIPKGRRYLERKAGEQINRFR